MSVSELRELSNRYGANPEYVLAGGGNTSFKDDSVLYVKGSGTSLATIDETGFVRLDRKTLDAIFTKAYPEDEDEREAKVLGDMLAARLPGEQKRPSVETLLHEIYPTAYVLHLHPALVNGFTCGKNARAAFESAFAQDSVWLGPTMPGYVLATRVRDAFADFRKKHGKYPDYLFLENHGVFTGADTVAQTDALFTRMMERLRPLVHDEPDLSPVPFDVRRAADLAPAVRCLCSDGRPGVAVFASNAEIARFAASAEEFSKASTCFTPDHLVYCRDSVLFLEAEETEQAYAELERKVAEYRKSHGFAPVIVGAKGLGFYAVAATKHQADIAAAVFENAIKIAVYARSFGGGKSLPDALVKSIGNWEVERYRRSVAFSGCSERRLGGKIAIVTGSAQGFGQGVAGDMADAGAYLGIADMNGEGAMRFAGELCEKHGTGAAVGIKVNVSDEADVQAMVDRMALTYGGLDIFVNNAGIVRAGSLDEMQLSAFELVTKVNYTAYFLCVKYATRVMKIQHRFSPKLYMDVIQINSKSGLVGSNKNFAYAGGKFGGLGLTQSFALELTPFNIKVNSICPGNFLDGPLWCDPDRGLFVQYLKAGKVPGAKTVADVKRAYEAKVPMNRGCQIRDVSRAIFYCVEQEYETGQAVPVTGGQVMLN